MVEAAPYLEIGLVVDAGNVVGQFGNFSGTGSPLVVIERMELKGDVHPLVDQTDVGRGDVALHQQFVVGRNAADLLVRYNEVPFFDACIT